MMHDDIKELLRLLLLFLPQAPKGAPPSSPVSASESQKSATDSVSDSREDWHSKEITGGVQ